jgi:branched-chain amino acid transport system substrate-binding protein
LSTAEGVPDTGRNVFRNSLTKSEQAAGLARLAFETLGIRRGAILFPQSSYGTEFMTLFWTEFTKLGGEIRGAEGYDPEAGDFGPPIKRLVGLSPVELRSQELCSEEEMNKRLKLLAAGEDAERCYTPAKLPPIVDFEALFIPDGFEKVTQIVPALSFYDARGIQVLGSNLLDTPDLFRARAGEAMQGALFLDGFTKNRNTPQVSQFVQRFYATFGTEPGALEAQAFDTASILLDLIARTHPASRAGFAQALSSVTNFPGVSGETSFSGGRDARHHLTVLAVDGEQVVELK